jgi:hypothetical protein
LTFWRLTISLGTNPNFPVISRLFGGGGHNKRLPAIQVKERLFIEQLHDQTIHLSICPFVHLCICLSVSQSIYRPTVSLSICLIICLFICPLPACLCFFLWVHPFVCLSIYPNPQIFFLSLYIHLSACLFLCQSMSQSFYSSSSITICPFFCPSLCVWTSNCTSLCMSLRPSLYHRTCLSHLSVHPHVCLPICLSIIMFICLFKLVNQEIKTILH